MLEKKISSLFFFGSSHRYLQDAEHGWRIKGRAHIIYNIDRFLGLLDELGFTVTRRAANDLAKFKDELAKHSADRLSDETASRLRKIMETLRPTLMAESSGTIAYIISERRFPIEALMMILGAFSQLKYLRSCRNWHSRISQKQ